MAVKDICFRCVVDPFLARQIKRNGGSASCCLCLEKRKCIPLSEIVARVEGILKLYVSEGEVDFMWTSGGVEQYQKGERLDYWVGEIFGCEEIEPIVKAVCDQLHSYSDDISYSRSLFMPEDVSIQWGLFQEGMKHGNRFFNQNARSFLDWLFKGLDGYSASSSDKAVIRILEPQTAAPIYRARTCMTPESVGDIAANPGRNLAAPPKDKAGEGRMNPGGVPAFYGALERKTCVAELRPPVGGVVVSGEFRLNSRITLLDFGRFETTDLGPVPSFFDSKYFAKVGRREFLRYLHDEITRPVLPGMERNYLITQVIAEYLSTHCVPRIDGVIFKSVQEASGTNIVLFSHVACAAEPVHYQVRGGRGLMGRLQTSACIEYVPDSLMYHMIRAVEYSTEDERLGEDKPRAPDNTDW